MFSWLFLLYEIRLDVFLFSSSSVRGPFYLCAFLCNGIDHQITREGNLLFNPMWTFTQLVCYASIAWEIKGSTMDGGRRLFSTFYRFELVDIFWSIHFSKCFGALRWIGGWAGRSLFTTYILFDRASLCGATSSPGGRSQKRIDKLRTLITRTVCKWKRYI